MSLRCVSVGALLLTANCATPPAEVDPRWTYETSKTQQELITCLADELAERKFQFVPPASFQYLALTSKAGLRVDLQDGLALVRVSGGPWLGKDEALAQVVEACVQS